MSLTLFSLTVPGRPVPKGRPRVGAGGQVYTPERTRNREAVFAWEARRSWCGQPPLAVPLEVTLVFRSTGWCGDLDNLAKLVLDALQTARVFTDDRHVWRLSLSREACARGDQQTSIRVEAL